MKGYRTLLFNICAAVLGVVVVFDWTDMLPPQYAWTATIIVALANVALRAVTTTPITKAS